MLQKHQLIVTVRTCQVNPPDGQGEVYVRPVEAATDGASQPDMYGDDLDQEDEEIGDDGEDLDQEDEEDGDDDKPEDDGDADEDLESGLK